VSSRVPIRINDIGGWTDTWFAGHGRVLNLAAAPGIEVHIRISPNPAHEPERVAVEVKDFKESFRMNPDAPGLRPHPLLQAAVAAVSVPGDVYLDIDIHASVPAGISVGSSAAVCVALLGGLTRLQQEDISPGLIASLAHRVETDHLGWQSGIQDQICAAFGGICFIDMPVYPDAEIEKIEPAAAIREELDARLLLVFLGSAHDSSALHKQVIVELEKTGSGKNQIRSLRELPLEARRYLLEGNLEAYGAVMIKNNECQRALHSDLVAPEADAVIAAAREHGAAGWKVNGAGGRGGSMTVLGSREPDRRARMRSALDGLGRGIRVLPVSLSSSGLMVRTEGTS
jgi:D-glycero-alpha-D-manno-heptose-7-phosphate kinase